MLAPPSESGIGRPVLTFRLMFTCGAAVVLVVASNEEFAGGARLTIVRLSVGRQMASQLERRVTGDQCPTFGHGA